jgi:hypothetical protein
MVGPNGLEPLTSTVSKRQRSAQAKSKNSRLPSVYAGVKCFANLRASAAQCSIVTPNQGGCVTIHVTKSPEAASDRLWARSPVELLMESLPAVAFALHLSHSTSDGSHFKTQTGFGVCIFLYRVFFLSRRGRSHTWNCSSKLLLNDRETRNSVERR